MVAMSYGSSISVRTTQSEILVVVSGFFFFCSGLVGSQKLNSPSTLCVHLRGWGHFGNN